MWNYLLYQIHKLVNVKCRSNSFFFFLHIILEMVSVSLSSFSTCTSDLFSATPSPKQTNKQTHTFLGTCVYQLFCLFLYFLFSLGLFPSIFKCTWISSMLTKIPLSFRPHLDFSAYQMWLINHSFLILPSLPPSSWLLSSPYSSAFPPTYSGTFPSHLCRFV